MRTIAAALIAGLCALEVGCSACGPPACGPVAYGPPRAPHGPAVSTFLDTDGTRLYRTYTGRIHVQQVVPES